jgi:methionine synthase II (cobalamin-independent)
MITGIGSLPFKDIDEAIDLIFATCPEIPFWPQLPARSSRENMYTTFLDNVPCIRVDEAKGAVYMDTEETKGIEEFYEHYSTENLDHFAISRESAPGFYRFLERLNEVKAGATYIKGQLTGPFSMGLGLPDESGKPIIYNYGYFDMIKKALRMKAKWMIRAIQEQAPGKDLIVFFDEPYMVSFGSAYVSIAKEEAIALFDEVTEGLPARRGVHCCGNTDWSVLFNTSIDIVNYDAYNFLETIFYFREDLAKFLLRGGWICPGIIPSSEKVLEVSLAEIRALWKTFLAEMDRTGVDAGSREWLFTTSCGLGSLGLPETEAAMRLLGDLAKGL